MRERGIVILVTIGLLTILGGSGAMAVEANPSPSTRELIERLTRIETRLDRIESRIEENHKNLQVQINGLQRQIDDNQKHLQRQIDDNQKILQRQIDDLKMGISDLKDFVTWGFGIMIIGMFALVTFVVWDRRTALAPTMNQVDDLRRKERDLEDVLRKYAFQDPRLAEILKSSGLL